MYSLSSHPSSSFDSFLQNTCVYVCTYVDGHDFLSHISVWMHEKFFGKKPNRKFPKINTCVLFRFVFSSTKFSDIFFVLDTLNLFTFCSFVFMSFNKDLVFVIVTPVFWIFTKKSTVFFFFFVFLRF